MQKRIFNIRENVHIYVYFYTSMYIQVLHLIIPNSIHPEPNLRNIHPRNPSQQLIAEPVNLHKTLLVVTKRQPLLAEITGTDGVGMAPAGGGGVDEELSLDVAVRTQFEGCYVPGIVECTAAGCGEEVVT